MVEIQKQGNETESRRERKKNRKERLVLDVRLP